MNIEIVAEPVGFRLHGIRGTVANDRFGEVGLRLMNEMWQMVRSRGIATTGINHWVYLDANELFVGVELTDGEPIAAAGALEPIEILLPRYARHLHVGAYQALSLKWRDFRAELASLGERVSLPSLEIYGHHCDAPSLLETTLLIGLMAKPLG